MPEPLSTSLERILSAQTADEQFTANQLMERTKGRGYYLLFILMSLPFVAWISVPGLSTILGSMIALLGLRLALELTPRLPTFLGDRPLSPRVRAAILGAGLKFCRGFERVVRPRQTSWMQWRLVRSCHALLIVLLALLLALPLPSPPFFGSNALPSYGIILLAAAMMEEDGVFIWIGYGMSAVSIGYFVWFGGFILKHLRHWIDLFLRLLETSQ
jgi:hypothetical protein